MRWSAFSLLAAALFAGCAGSQTEPRFSLEELRAPRRIPLRIVKYVHCQGCADCQKSCVPGPGREQVQANVDAANYTFWPTGAQFFIRELVRVEAPDFWDKNATPQPRTWAEIREELRRVFPWMPADAFADPAVSKQNKQWLDWATVLYARPDEITIHVQTGGPTTVGQSPEQGRALWGSDLTFGDHPRRNHGAGTLFVLAHELGHYLGLAHTFDSGGGHPVTGRPWTLLDRWDLAYRPGSSPADPHVFFSSRELAARFPAGELRLIHSRSDDSHNNCRPFREEGAWQCVLPGRGGYAETHDSYDGTLGGLTIALPQEAPGGYRFAANVMAYEGLGSPRRLSPSQVAIVRLFLENEAKLDAKALRRIGRLPDGMERAPTTYRTNLGLRAEQ
jgi:hypothetical protein